MKIPNSWRFPGYRLIFSGFLPFATVSAFKFPKKGEKAVSPVREQPPFLRGDFLFRIDVSLFWGGLRIMADRLAGDEPGKEKYGHKQNSYGHSKPIA